MVADAIIWVTPDTDGQMQDLFAEFWANDNMSVDDATERYAQILEDAE